MLFVLIKIVRWLFGAALAVAGFIGSYFHTAKPDAGDWQVQILSWLSHWWVFAPLLFGGGAILSHDLMWKIIKRRMERAAKPEPDMTFREMFDYIRLKASVSF
jgi:hypothetical protein